MRTSYKFKITIVFIAIISAALILGFGLRRANKTAGNEMSDDMSKQLESYQSLISRGVKQERKYILPTVMMIVKIDKVTEERIESDSSIFYQIQALKDISRENKVFQEFCTALSEKEVKSQPEEVNYQPGSDEEKLTQNEKQNQSWEVRFDLKAGQRRMIVTRCHRTYLSPFEAGRRVYDLFGSIGKNEEVFLYPSGDDVIGEIVIMIETSSLNFVTADARIQQYNGERQTVPVSLHPDHKVAVARFSNIQNRDTVGLKLGW